MYLCLDLCIYLFLYFSHFLFCVTGSGKEWLEAAFAERRMNSEKTADFIKEKERQIDKKNSEVGQNYSRKSIPKTEFKLTKKEGNKNADRSDNNSLLQSMNPRNEGNQESSHCDHEKEEFEEKKSAKKSKRKGRKSKKIKKIIDENDVEILPSEGDGVEMQNNNNNENKNKNEKTDHRSMLLSLPNILSENSLRNINSSSSSGRNSSCHTPQKNSNNINTISHNSILNANNNCDNNNNIDHNHSILHVSNNDKNNNIKTKNCNIDNNISCNYDFNSGHIPSNNHKISVNSICDISNRNSQSEITLAEVLADIERTREFSKRSARGLQSNLQFDLPINSNQSNNPQSHSSLKLLDLLPVSLGTFFDPSSSTDEKGRFKIQDPR